MRNSALTVLLGLAGASVLALAMTERIQAQSGAGGARVACVDVMKVINEYQRSKDLREEIAATEQELNAENERRRAEIDERLAAVEKLDADEPTRAERMRALRQMTIEYKVWGEVKETDMTAEIARWSVKIYREVQDAVAKVAQEKGYDVVLYLGDFTPQSMDPQQIQEQVRRNKVLYCADHANLTQEVLDEINKTYRSQPQVDMLKLD